MHQDQRQFSAPRNVGNARVATQRRHVVDDFRAYAGGGIGNFGLANSGLFNTGTANSGLFNNGSFNFGIGLTGNDQIGIGLLTISRS